MTAMRAPDAAAPAFTAPYGEDDVAIAQRIWPAAEFGADGNRRVLRARGRGPSRGGNDLGGHTARVHSRVK